MHWPCNESKSFTCCHLHTSHSGSQLEAQLLRQHLQGLLRAALTINNSIIDGGRQQLVWSKFSGCCAVMRCH